MSELVMIAFPSEAKAEQVRQKLLAMQKEYLIELGDAVIAVKDANGRIKLNQLLNTTATGAVSGTFWGRLVGLSSWWRPSAPPPAPPPAPAAALSPALASITSGRRRPQLQFNPARRRCSCWSAR